MLRWYINIKISTFSKQNLSFLKICLLPSVSLLVCLPASLFACARLLCLLVSKSSGLLVYLPACLPTFLPVCLPVVLPVSLFPCPLPSREHVFLPSWMFVIFQGEFHADLQFSWCRVRVREGAFCPQQLISNYSCYLGGKHMHILTLSYTPS